jgi:hypothetical protein
VAGLPSGPIRSLHAVHAIVSAGFDGVDSLVADSLRAGLPVILQPTRTAAPRRNVTMRCFIPTSMVSTAYGHVVAANTTYGGLWGIARHDECQVLRGLRTIPFRRAELRDRYKKAPRFRQ